VGQDIPLPILPAPSPTSVPPPTVAALPPGVLAYITPSPGASPVAVTTQFQVVPTYSAIAAVCVGPPLEVFTGNFSNPAPTGPRYVNTSWTAVGTGSCSTDYSTSLLTICTTTLTGLLGASTITDCNQDITFSTDHGAVIVTPTPNPTLQGFNGTTFTPQPRILTITTYYHASWTEFTTGLSPQRVEKDICANGIDGIRTCIMEYERWATVNVTQIATTTQTIDITSTYPGPGTIYVHTAHWEVTDTVTTFSLSTELEILTSTSGLSLSRQTMTYSPSGNTMTMAVASGPTPAVP
jgi:hypothetical protein